MTKHFAASWLQSLSVKLEALTEWSWAADKRGSCTTHRNLFREFFSAPFQKTLALVDEAKKTEFLGVIEKNLYKFDANTQQFPLMCLCALLLHGKDSPKTHEKLAAWVGFLLERLRRPVGAANGSPVADVAEECLSAPFQKFVPLMEDGLRNRLADGLGERLGELDEDAQRRVLDGLPAIPARLVEIVSGCTEELNGWLVTAPRFPATPLALADTLAKLEHPLVRFFTAVKQPARKEAFLVSVALALQGLRTKFRWMCATEPDLESLGAELQRKLFTVEGQGPVMDMWLSSRLKKYNTEVATRAAAVLAGNQRQADLLVAKLQAVFPASPEEGVAAALGGSAWLSLEEPVALGNALLAWLSEAAPDYFCPQHTLARDTVANVLLRFHQYFEMDPAQPRARIRARFQAQAAGQARPEATQPAAPHQAAPLVPGTAPPAQPGLGAAAAATTASGGAAQMAAQIAAQAVLTAAAAARHPPPPPMSTAQAQSSPSASNALVPFVMPPPPGTRPPQTVPPPSAPPSALESLTPGAPLSSLGAALAQLRAPAPPASTAPAAGSEVCDNLVDLLLNEALAGVAPEVRAKITKVEHGVYRMGSKEVTLHTQSGRLYVYRIGEVVRNVPFHTLLKEEGLVAVPQLLVHEVGGPGGAGAAPAVSSTAPAPGGAAAAPVDSSAVARIAAASQRISTGVSSTSSARQDPQALMSKRVEAATKAMDISKQIVRRSVNFDDEKLLRKLLSKGLRHDRSWQGAYQEFCTSRGISETDHKGLNKEFVANFIEQNLAKSINEEWAQKILYPTAEGEGEKKEKKEKKDKKDKKKKDKKRKAASDSSSSGAPAGDGSPAHADGGQQLALPAPRASTPSPPRAAGGPAGGRPPPGQPGPGMMPGMPGMAGMPGMDPMAMQMFGMPFGMAGMMGMPGGMMGPMQMFGGDASMAGMGFPGVGFPDERARKKAKKEEKGEKSKKEKGSKAKR